MITDNRISCLLSSDIARSVTYLNSTLKTSVNWIIRLLLSLFMFAQSDPIKRQSKPFKYEYRPHLGVVELHLVREVPRLIRRPQHVDPEVTRP